LDSFRIDIYDPTNLPTKDSTSSATPLIHELDKEGFLREFDAVKR
jgi:hypothetical protein